MMCTNPHPVNHVGWSLILMNINTVYYSATPPSFLPKQIFPDETLSCINMAQFCSIICIMHQSWIMAQYCASCIKIVAQSCAPYHGSMLCIHSSLMCIRHQYGSMLCMHQASIQLNAVHTSGINLTQLMLCTRHQFQLNAVYQASTWLCIMHQYDLMLCIHTRHQYMV